MCHMLSCKGNNLSFHLKRLESEEQAILRINKRDRITKIKRSIDKTDRKKQQRKSNETKSWFFEVSCSQNCCE